MNNMKQINQAGQMSRLIAVLSVLILSACANAAPPPIAASNEVCVETGRWMDPKTRSYVQASDITKQAASSAVVLLGETHVNNDHHIWQLQTIAQMHSINPDMILGFESFPREVQGALDKWVAGDLSEKDFLDQSKWNEFWRYDPNLYMALFNFARINRVPMVALNINRDLINKVSAKGWDSIKKTERDNIDNPEAASAGYIKILKDVFKEHDNKKNKGGEKNKDGAAFDRFVDVQLTWDRAFAQAIAQAIESTLMLNSTVGRNPVVVGIVGRGHIDYGFGVQAQLKALGVSDITALAPWDDFQNCSGLIYETTAVTDYVFGTSANTKHPGSEKPKLGVFIEQGEGGVAVKKVAPKSIAENSGIKSGDLLVEAAGKTLKNPSDLINAVNATAPGTWLPLKVMRNNKVVEIVAKFKR